MQQILEQRGHNTGCTFILAIADYCAVFSFKVKMWTVGRVVLLSAALASDSVSSGCLLLLNLMQVSISSPTNFGTATVARLETSSAIVARRRICVTRGARQLLKSAHCEAADV